MKLQRALGCYLLNWPAAFRRLCVETKLVGEIAPMIRDQPPSGGCVLKLHESSAVVLITNQPPSGGCVLKQQQLTTTDFRRDQPPSGGCVLKPG